MFGVGGVVGDVFGLFGVFLGCLECFWAVWSVKLVLKWRFYLFLRRFFCLWDLEIGADSFTNPRIFSEMVTTYELYQLLVGDSSLRINRRPFAGGGAVLLSFIGGLSKGARAAQQRLSFQTVLG